MVPMFAVAMASPGAANHRFESSGEQAAFLGGGAAARPLHQRGVQPRQIDIGEMRVILREQGAHLTDDAAVAAVGQAEAAE